MIVLTICDYFFVAVKMKLLAQVIKVYTTYLVENFPVLLSLLFNFDIRIINLTIIIFQWSPVGNSYLTKPVIFVIAMVMFFFQVLVLEEKNSDGSWPRSGAPPSYNEATKTTSYKKENQSTTSFTKSPNNATG